MTQDGTAAEVQPGGDQALDVVQEWVRAVRLLSVTMSVACCSA
ncbi:hypothetical protein ACQPZP_00480 [Spirillospora sp. CA-142024]